jgi:hypothetical protein
MLVVAVAVAVVAVVAQVVAQVLVLVLPLEMEQMLQLQIVAQVAVEAVVPLIYQAAMVHLVLFVFAMPIVFLWQHQQQARLLLQLQVDTVFTNGQRTGA